MNRLLLISILLLLIGAAGPATAGTWVYTGTASSQNCGKGLDCEIEGYSSETGLVAGDYAVSVAVTASFANGACAHCNNSCGTGERGTDAWAAVYKGSTIRVSTRVCSGSGSGSNTGYEETTLSIPIIAIVFVQSGYGSTCCPTSASGVIIISNESAFSVSGDTGCVDLTELYIYNSGSYHYINSTSGSSYSFRIYDGLSYRLLFDGAYYDFTCDGNEVFDYDACLYVYGYTCGVNNIKLYKDDSGWVLDDSAGQSTGYDVYEMVIEDGEDYKISFIDSTIDGDIVVHNQTFSCTGDHVLIDFDRCQWIYPPNGLDIPIYLWSGYDYNVVVFKDNHGNMVENAELAVYDNTANTYIQKWTGNKEGYALLGAKFDTDHDVLMMLRTFDGVFTLDTTYPANGSALVGEEDITTTNWTIPIKYNLNVLPVDQYGGALFDVFCGLSEYTPLNPGAFWGMDLSDQGYVAVTNCSGFAMCDIIAEKEGYADYKVEALNWTSKSALVKDYRHNVVMEEE